MWALEKPKKEVVLEKPKAKIRNMEPPKPRTRGKKGAAAAAEEEHHEEEQKEEEEKHEEEAPAEE